MKPIHDVVAALLISAQLLIPSAAMARGNDQDDDSAKPARLELPPPIFADAAQGGAGLKNSTPGGKLLRNTLIGAAAGAAFVGIVIGGAEDCGSCGADQAKDILSGAMFGALIGAAIRI